MPDKPTFDVTAAHKFFAADCYNQTWNFIDKSNRTPEEDLSMLQTAMASLWHWSQREDVTAQNFAIGNWQVSRVFASMGQVENARRYGELSLSSAQGGEPVYIGFAYEALARAEMVAGDQAKMNTYLQKAHLLVEQVKDIEDKEALINDLITIK